MKYKKVKIFDGKKITIRSLSKGDLKKARKFQNFINSFVEENAQIGMNKKVTLKEETNWLKRTLRNIEKRQLIYLLAEYNNIIIGSADINLLIWRQSHVGNFGIAISKDYRRIGLGKYLSREIIKLAKKQFKSSLKIIKLSVLPTNKPAKNLYKKLGFKEVARVPDQNQYKGKLVDDVIMLLYLSKKAGRSKRNER